MECEVFFFILKELPVWVFSKLHQPLPQKKSVHPRNFAFPVTISHKGIVKGRATNCLFFELWRKFRETCLDLFWKVEMARRKTKEIFFAVLDRRNEVNHIHQQLWVLEVLDLTRLKWRNYESIEFWLEHRFICLKLYNGFCIYFFVIFEFSDFFFELFNAALSESIFIIERNQSRFKYL